MKTKRYLVVSLSICAVLSMLVVAMAHGPRASAAGEGACADYFDRMNGIYNGTYSTGSLGEGVCDTYFNHIQNGNYDLISPNQDGSNSYGSSVMPNWTASQVTVQWDTPLGRDGGAGAVGTAALGITQGKSLSYYSGPTDNRTRKEALFNFLKNKYNGGSAWEKMGSALIVNQMLQKKWGEGSRTITPTQFEDLYNRLVTNDAVSMDRIYANSYDNTAGVRLETFPGSEVYQGQFDAVKWLNSHSSSVDAWVFSVNGSVVYKLEIICANPLGSLGGLPVAPPKNDKYDLKPTARIDGPRAVEPGGSTTITNAVKNEGVDPSGSTTARLTQVVYQPGAPSSLNGMKVNDDPKEPCDIFPAANRKSCDKVQEKTGLVFQSGAEVSFDTPFIYNVPSNTPVGTRICFTVSVKPPAQDKPNQWRHSALQCIIVAKRPKVQVWGGDVRVGGSINAVANALDGLSYGSWGEYGALSNGQNSGFGTGNGLDGGNANSSQAGWSSLTFANMNTCTFGCYNFTLTSRALGDQFGSGNDRPPSNDLNSWSNGTYAVNGIELGPLTLGRGKSIVIISSGTVTIKGDIAYDDGAPYESIKDIPQLVIRAPKIDIQGNVGRVDAWLIAVASTNGVLNTCSDKAAPDDDRLTSNICSNPLTINGPVVADRIYLRRTAGSDNSNASTRGTPAETFNLRADAYLWGNAYANGKGKVRTVYTKELPPRF